MDNVDRVLAQWHAERPDVDPAPMGVVGRIQRASRLLEKGLATYFATHDLQLWEFDILATLRRAGRMTAGRLVTASMVTSGAITNRVDRLVTRGLVTREVDPDNRRSVLIDLTAEGRTLVDKILAGHIDNENRLLAPLDLEDRDRLANLLRTLLTGLGDVPD
ncbi:MarR family winged helix-turn-helix transcriptional regulator [Actinokineospora globicatena]|uniref:MarR family transcriptional regulator n=1 Tax=Actinokineospora globicatena TaxID=103729 RepID=A0A9W6QHN8_9PSEU|nr:MarR family transcriptional regulator [Actinokineospora globicatena]MCP2304580.1 DNA-binding transcriptional regulator, MarR family [Actinokineospora globicatena]GLW78051.1 MarR family transcriptional regulator [Actinokineospora globicatena]GLW85283.1 MarR family transcriptional regulator [Actinokineospora globicatena]GLW90638.1 MarR family transcriptional regulator [Actinokineospora globicatena]